MANVDSNWNLVIKSPMGDQNAVLTAKASGDTITGTCTYEENTTNVADGKIDGDNLTWNSAVTVPTPMTLHFNMTVAGDTMSGTVRAATSAPFRRRGHASNFFNVFLRSFN